MPDGSTVSGLLEHVGHSVVDRLLKRESCALVSSYRGPWTAQYQL